MAEMIRTFVAVDLPDTVAASIRVLQNELRDQKFKIKWVRTDNLHLTLKFLGDTRADRIAVVNQALENAAAMGSPMTLGARGLGVFPGIRRPRVVWVGIDGDVDTLMRLQQAIDGTLASAGFPPETRSFKAHLTIGRVKGRVDTGRLLEVVQHYQRYRSESFQIKRFGLIQSDLKPQGPQYSYLAKYDLSR